MKYRKSKGGILEGDLTPMIDMTFQLIAFFMLLINFSEVDRAEEIVLPVSLLAVPPTERPDYQIILNLEPDGSVKFFGQRFESIARTTAVLRSEISFASREKVPVEAIAVIIRAHQDTPTGLVQGLINKCQEEKLENFSLRVKDRDF